MVIACNTAHLLLPKLEMHIGHSFVSLIQITVDKVKSLAVDKVGLLASPTTIKSKLYQKRLEDIGVQVITPTTSQIDEIEDCIRAVIAGADTIGRANGLRNILRHMKLQGAQSVILGCTELSVVFSGVKDQSIIDPLTLAAIKLLGENDDE
jgi:aspartate racemase